MHMFTVLHFSDLHIAVTAGVRNVYDALRARDFQRGRIGLTRLTSHNPLMLEAVARFVYQEQHAIDLVLVTGDLSTTGSHADLARAYEFVDSPVANHWLNDATRPTLRTASTADGSRVRLLPGNHDRYCDNLGHDPGGKVFDTVFGRYWGVGQGAQTQAVLEMGEARLAVISADLSLHTKADAVGPLGAHLGQGKVYDSVLGELTARTHDVLERFTDVGIIWAVHFPPSSPDAHEAIDLLESDKFLQSARNLGIQHIFAGHTHVPRGYDTMGVTIHCAGSASHCCSPAGNHFHLCQVTVDRGSIVAISTLTYTYDRNTRNFEQA